jgi:hypothetical protein
MLAHPQQQDIGSTHYAQLSSHNANIVCLYMNDTVDRFLLLLELERVKMPWLEGQTGIETKRWHSIKQRKVMRTSELDAITCLYPEYAYWLATGKELVAAGQVSPLTKRQGGQDKNS